MPKKSSVSEARLPRGQRRPPSKSQLAKFKRVIGAALREQTQDIFHDPMTKLWDSVTAQIARDVYVQFDGCTRAKVRVVDGCAGETWWESNLSDLVEEFVEETEAAFCGGSEVACHEAAGWMCALARDLERQAKQLRESEARLIAGSQKSSARLSLDGSTKLSTKNKSSSALPK